MGIFHAQFPDKTLTLASYCFAPRRRRIPMAAFANVLSAQLGIKDDGVALIDRLPAGRGARSDAAGNPTGPRAMIDQRNTGRILGG
jgi:hypothetical protein